MSALDQLKDLLGSLAGCLCSSDSTLKLNGRQYRVIKLLGEGGFSYVYLAEDSSSNRLFALKKIRCPQGTDSVEAAMKEVEAYKRFRHENIIRCYDSCVVQDEEGSGKIVYLFLPYYKKGTVQDIINDNYDTGRAFPEQEMLRIFLGASKGLRRMHHNTTSQKTTYPPSDSRTKLMTATSSKVFDLEDELVDDDNEGRSLMPGLESALQQEREEAGAAVSSASSDLTSWAHRDIKPANIMLSDNNTPILMDFGSVVPGRIPVPTRTEALNQQDIAAEHCSMAFRAPELFDVKTGTDLTTAVDIWSLGCTLFAMAYGYSPFETPSQAENGGSVAMAAMTGKYTFPASPEYSEEFKNLIRALLVVDPTQRPTIDDVISKTESLLV